MSVALARLRTSAWLGWLVDSNWTDPTLFVIYVVIRPLAVALILTAMYWAVRGAAVHDALFAGFFVANAFHGYVNTIVVDMGWVIFSEREEYETLKYVVASPVGLGTFVAGRSVIKFARGTISVALTLLVGWLALGIRWSWGTVEWGPLALSIALGLVATLFIAFLVAGAALLFTRAAIVVLEGITLGLYLLCGVIFPIDLLPRALQLAALTLPFTWWYEALRRFLLGHGSSALLSRLSDAQLLGGLAVSTAAFCAVSIAGFRLFEHHARRLGRIDQTTLF